MTSQSEEQFPAFEAHAAQLETHIAEAEQRGEEVPAEARAMLASLREIARAMHDLRSSLGGQVAEQPPAGYASPEETPPE